MARWRSVRPRGGGASFVAARALAVLAALGAAAGCGREAVPGGAGTAGAGRLRPLVDDRHALELLVEKQRLARPPSTSGNRLLSGWSPAVVEGRLNFQPAPGRATLEVVHLARRPRRLVLDLPDCVMPATGKVRVSHAGRELASVSVADPMELALPADLPLGRVTLDLAWTLPRGAAQPPVAGAGVRPALHEGRVARRGGDLVQSGDSLVELVRPVGGGEGLVGSFRPPAWPRGGGFELLVERDGGAVVGRFGYEPSFLDVLRRPRPIRLPVGAEPGFVRVRLLARGSGPAGRWEGLALASQSAAAAALRPNPPLPSRVAVLAPPPRLVVLYVMDALRAGHVGHLGGAPELTPTLDRLAAEGRVYRRHRSLAPNTLPSTKALFTGWPVLSGGDDQLPAGQGPTLAERFRAAGYRTALVSGNVFVSPAFGMDRGFEHVAQGVLVDRDSHRAAGFNDNAARVHAAALAWLRALQPGARAFLYLHVIHPHNPYDPPGPFRRRFAGGSDSRIGSTEALLAVRAGKRRLGPGDADHLAGLYAAGLAYNDSELAGFLREVAALVLPRETVLAVTSDHGEELFEHGGVLHGYTLYEEMIRIPAVLWGPGRVAPAAVTAPTDTLDLRRALLATAGLATTPEAPPPAPEPPVHLAAAASIGGGIFSAQSTRWKVIWAPRRGAMWGQGEGIGRSRDPEYAFDLVADPGETVNRVGSASLEAAWLRQRLLAWVRSDSAAGEIDAPIDEETRRRLQALGYLR